jgi:hypothetical protein
VLTGVPGRRLSKDYLGGATGDMTIRHMAAVAGGAESVRGWLGSGTGVRGSGVWLGVGMGAAGPIAGAVVEPAGSK